MEYMTEFTPYRSLIGGALIGLSMVLFLWLNGRIAGVSGIIHGISFKKSNFQFWRIAFLAGLIMGGVTYFYLPEIQFKPRYDYPVFLLLIGGIFVGFGTQLAKGCTSGHGVCGIARFSKRSIVATMTFMVFGALTVYISVSYTHLTLPTKRIV